MKQTTLDLNGPILSFTTQPVGVTVNSGQTATFTGIATASFPTQTPANIFATNTGSLSYRWYAEGYGALSDGTFLGATISGSATTTLSISNVQTPTTSGIRIYLAADYVPSAYQTSSPVTAGTGRSTGNAINELLNSNVVTLTVNPVLSISSQPSSSTISQGGSTSFSVAASASDSSGVSYQWYVNGNPVSDGSGNISGITFSGTNTPTLTVSTSNSVSVASYNVNVVISNPTASNSPLTSNTVILDVVAARKIINLEKVNQVNGVSNSSSATLITTNVFFDPFILAAEQGDPVGTVYSFYASEADIDVLVELYGSTGFSNGGYRGGQGGTSVIRMTMQKNVEYFVSALPQATGGAGVFLWRKSKLIACCGGGGNAGNGGNGGDGGGVNLSGGDGTGRGAGRGGILYAPGTLPSTSGLFGSLAGQAAVYPEDGRASAPDGGRVLGCSKGGTAPGNSYWMNRGFSPCQDVGTTQLVNADGYVIPNTAFINRGHKVGYACRQTAGVGLNGGGNGANGATGGQGGNGGGGGGGGSGYTDGSVTIISTARGGHTGLAKVIIRNIP